MNNPNQLLSEKIDEGVKKAISEAIEKHRRLGQSIAIWQDGKVVILTADLIPPLIPNVDRELSQAIADLI
jgi:hypothetical protein